MGSSTSRHMPIARERSVISSGSDWSGNSERRRNMLYICRYFLAYAHSKPVCRTKRGLVSVAMLSIGACAFGQSVALSNLSNRGNPNLQIGDTYRVTIASAGASQSVQVCATLNGSSLGCSTVGSTDSSGNFSLTGSDSSTGDEGSWLET